MITYITGDATCPIGDGPKIIAHVCNDSGGWGRGFVTALSARWDAPERAYRGWWDRTRVGTLPMGAIQLVKVVNENGPLLVANMIGQHRWSFDESGDPPIRYPAVKQALRAVSQEAKIRGASVHMPRIGCGLAGGTWDQIEPLIEWAMDGIPVYVYDLAENDEKVLDSPPLLAL